MTSISVSRRSLAVIAALTTMSVALAQGRQSATDPRVGLKAGLTDAGQAARGMELVATLPKPVAFDDPQGRGGLNFANSDLAFEGTLLVQGNFNGLNFFEIEDPRRPQLRASVVCPGGQGDVSVYGHLLFMSVEETRGALDSEASRRPCSLLLETRKQGMCPVTPAADEAVVHRHRMPSDSAACVFSTWRTLRARGKSPPCRPAADQRHPHARHESEGQDAHLHIRAGHRVSTVG